MEDSANFGFEDFSIEMGDFKVKRVGEFERIWKIGPGGSIIQKPLIKDGILYFGSCNQNLYAVDVNTGALIWKFKTEGIIMESHPKYWNNSIYFGSFDYNFYCIDAKNGQLKWKFATRNKIGSAAAIHNGKVYFGSKDENFYCLDATTGELVWKFRTYGDINFVPLVHDNKVFFGSFDRFFYCVDSETGKLVWKFETQGELHSSNPCLIHNEILYFASLDNYLRAIDLKTQKLIWKLNTGFYGNDTSPQVHENILYHATRGGNLFAITLEGKIVWKCATKHHFALPAFHEGKIYVGSEDKNMHCFSLEGKRLWSYRTNDIVFVSPVFHDGKIIFASWDCNVYSVDLETRLLAWKFKADGSPSYLAPIEDGFEFIISSDNFVEEGEKKKRYDFNITDETDHNVSAYKSRVTYQMSTQYSSKGKYQVDSQEEEF